MVVQHNLTAMNSNRNLGLTTSSQAKSTEKLSSGYKINRAADDAAGLSISEKMRKQIRGLTQASSNAQDGISAVQTAEGALSEVQDMLQRMNELAVKSANGTQSESDRSYIQNEIDQLTTEIDRVAETTKFNETYLLKGDREAVKEVRFDYKANTKNAVAKAEEVSVTGTALFDTTKVEFQGGSQDAQNELALALSKQGVNFTAVASYPNTAASGSKKYTLELNGDAKDKYTVTQDDPEVGKFNILDKTGVLIAEITLDGTDVTIPSKGDPDVSASGTATFGKLTAAEVEGAKTKYYDKDGNAIAANALDGYFAAGEPTTDTPPKATAVAKSDAPKVYDYFGQETTLDKSKVTATQDLVGALTLKLHVGADATSNNQISVNLDAMSAKGLGVNGLKVDGLDDSNAKDAIDTIKEAIQKVSTQRSALGAAQNRLEHTINNLDNVVENTTSAESSIRDTDMAEEMVRYSNNNILTQAGQAMLAQANQSNQGILSLLG